MEFGQGKRKKRRAAILLHSSDSGSQSDSNSDDKRKNKRMRHKLEKKIPPPPQVLLFDDYVGSPCKESQNFSKYLISKQHPKITQNIVLQENREKDTSSVRESKCKQNKISIKTASDSGLYDKNSELLQKLKSLKEQTSEKKKTIGDKKNCSSYNKDKENQREYSEPNNKQNESALHNVTLCSSSHQSLQEEEKNKVYKLTSQNKKRFPNKSSSIMTNELSSCINTSCINTSVKQISMDEHSSNSINTTIRCPDSPDTLSSKSSASVRKSNLVQNKDNHRRSLSFNSTGTEYSSSKGNSITDSSVQSISCKEITALQKIMMDCKKEIRRMSSKLDISIMNQENLCHFIIPGNKVIKRPYDMPPLPISTLEELNSMEKFLANDSNLTGAFMEKAGG